MTAAPGVHVALPDGGERQVHQYEGGDYGLADIAELFQLGEARLAEGDVEVLEIDHRDLMKLKPMADAYSFDFEEGLIRLCLDLHAHAEAAQQDRYRFWADF